MASLKSVTRWQKLKTSINLFFYLGLIAGGIFGFLFGGFLGPVGFLIFTVGLMGIGAVCGALIPSSLFALGILCNALLEKLPTKLSSPIFDTLMPVLDFFGLGLEKLVIWSKLIEQKFASGFNPPPVNKSVPQEFISSPQTVSFLMQKTLPPNQEQIHPENNEGTDRDARVENEDISKIENGYTQMNNEDISSVMQLIEEEASLSQITGNSTQLPLN